VNLGQLIEMSLQDDFVEAQSFKRSCVCFGLGRYLYHLAEIWVPLNEHRQPFEFPSLPQWALPKGSMPAMSHPASGSRPPAAQRGPIDQKTTVRIEGFRRIPGDPIYGEILWRVAHARQANAIPNPQLQANVSEAMERASRGVSKAHSLADQVGETSFIAILDKLRIESMTAILRLEMLKTLVAELEREAAELPPNRTRLSPWTRRRAYAQCSHDPSRAGPGFNSCGERCLLREL
jgi:hypothetical protein